MSNQTSIVVNRRESEGSTASRRLRRQGLVPAVVYGAGLDPLSIQVEQRTVQRLVRVHGENAVFLLTLEGTDQSRHTMIKAIQYDPLDGSLVHIDFHRVMMDQMVRVRVPVEIEGIAFGVKNEGGMVDFVTRDVEIECLPADIPVHFTVDISPLHLGQHLEASAIQLPSGVTLVEEPTRVILSVTQARTAGPAEGEEAETLIEAPTQEPEVIHKGKEETE